MLLVDCCLSPEVQLAKVQLAKVQLVVMSWLCPEMTGGMFSFFFFCSKKGLSFFILFASCYWLIVGCPRWSPGALTEVQLAEVAFRRLTGGMFFSFLFKKRSDSDCFFCFFCVMLLVDCCLPPWW